MKRRGTTVAAAALGLALLAGCSEKQSVKFGAVLPLSAAMAGPPELAESVKRGLELAFEHLEADSEIKYELELEIQDSQGDPQKAAQLADQLYGSSIAVIGGVTTEEAVAMAEVSKKAEKLLLSPTAIGDQLSGVSRTTFYRLFPPATQQASAMANFAKERLNVAEMVVLVDDRAFSQGGVEGLRTVFTQYGGKVTAEIPVTAGADLAPVVDQALQAQPSGIYIAAAGAATADIVKLLRERGYGMTEGKPEWIMTTSAFSHPEIYGRAGRGAEGVYLTAPLFDLAVETPPVPAFLTAYREKYGEDPDLYAGHGYDAMYLFGAALKKTTNTLPAEFSKGFRSMGSITGVTGTIQFNENGDAQRFARVHAIREGKLVDFQTWYTRRQEEIRKRIEDLRRDATRLHTQPGATSDTQQ
jgi:branched-chain amino acid transport system substrate-binding protein